MRLVLLWLLLITACESIGLELKTYGKYWVYNYTMKECGFTNNESSAIILKDIIREKYPEICDQAILRFKLVRGDAEETYSYFYCK